MKFFSFLISLLVCLPCFGVNHLGNFIEDKTVKVEFWTYQTDGAPVAPSSAFETADFKIYKDGGSTEKTAVDGLTIASPFDGIVGYHTLLIDTSNDTNDIGFWVAGSTYVVVLDPDETVDSIAVGYSVADFAIQDRFMRGTDSAALASVLGAAVGADISADIAAVKAETASILTDTSTTIPGTITTLQADTDDIQTRLPTSLSGNGNIKADTLEINSVLVAAVNLSLSAGTMLPGTVDTDTNAATTTTMEADDITEATADHFIGRIIIWTSGVLQYQATVITDYELLGSNGKFTFIAVTEAAGNNDTFIIL